jgi:hypothetical protein
LFLILLRLVFGRSLLRLGPLSRHWLVRLREVATDVTQWDRAFEIGLEIQCGPCGLLHRLIDSHMARQRHCREGRREILWVWEGCKRRVNLRVSRIYLNAITVVLRRRNVVLWLVLM